MMSRNLEIFIQVAENKSITKTAKIMYLTQPAVSNAIHKLESDLNVKLFFRDKKNGLILTEVGEKILTLAKQMENIDNHIMQVAYQENHLIEGHLKIAALTSLVSTVLSKAVKVFRDSYPNIVIDIIEGTPNDVYQMVEKHHVDFAISSSPFHQFDAIVLVHDQMIATLPPEHIHPQTVDLSSPQDFLIINKPAYETLLDHMSPKDFIKTDYLMVVQTAETVLHMTKEGIGVGIISEYTLNTLASHYQKIPLLPHVSFDIGLFTNDLNDLTPAAKAFVDIIQDIHSIKV